MTTSPATTRTSSSTTQTPFLVVDDLHVHFPTDDGLVKSVDGVSFELEAGRTLGIVGESGSGKSVTSQAIMGLHRRTNARVTGQILLDDEDLLTVTDNRIRELRGDKLAMIFQDPMSSLHPYYTIGNQIMEGYRIHNDVSKAEARKATMDVLDRVGIPNSKVRIDQYPHEFSGGMRQRAMIAMALVNNPKLLIADEPTTALDVTVQAQILNLMKDLQKEYGSAIIIITHDLGVVADMADDLLVMYGGKPVETGSVQDVFYRPEHPYTWGLLSSMPRMDQARKERLVPILGTPPSLINLPTGCSFNPRCRFKDRVPGDKCRTDEPELLEAAPNHEVRCHIDSPQRQQIFETEIKPVL
jgi:peptide/nickel transport system ATP-binding protein